MAKYTIPGPRAEGDPITLTPNTVTSGTAPLTVTVTGTGFDAESGVAFDGGSVVTTFVDASTLTIGVTPPADETVTRVVPVWVITAGTSSAPADFTFAAVRPPMMTATHMEAILKSWGVSGEPLGWAPDKWTPTISATRQANLGFGTAETVQGLLDATWPGEGLRASNIIVVVSGVTASAKSAKDGSVTLRADVADLPVENITWYLDGLIVGHGRDVPVGVLPAGEHVAEVQVAIAGSVYAARVTVGEPVS